MAQARERERESKGRQRALPTETKVESGTSQSKSGTSVNLSNSGELIRVGGYLIVLRGASSSTLHSGVRRTQGFEKK